jgi:PAS domain S-box-containing protein
VTDPAASSTFVEALTELEPALSALTVPEALAAAAGVVMRRAGAPYVGVFLLEQGEVVAEGWAPAGAEQETGRRAAVRAAIVRARAAEDRPGAGTGPRTIAFPAGANLGGVACLAPDAGAGEPALESIRGMLRVLGLRLHALHAGAAAASTREQYERWFRTLDEQVRVLDRERQKFAVVVQQSDACVFVVDTARAIRWTNSAMRQKCLEGGTAALQPGDPCSTVCTRMGENPARGCGECPLSRALAENQIVHREFRWERQGQVHNHYLTALPIRGADGRPQEVMVMIQDLGDLEILRKSEARYRQLFERSNKAILLVDPRTARILQSNPMAVRMSGHLADQLSAMSLSGLFEPAEWSRLEGYFAEGFGQRALEPRECRIRTRNGTERIAMVAGARYELGEQEVIMLDFQDVTERRRVEEALRKAEISLRTVVSHVPIVLFSIDADGIFTMSEGKGLQALGLQPGQVVGRSVFDVYEPFPHVLDMVRRALKGDEFTASVELGGITFETRYSPLRDERGRVTGVIGVAIDVSERRRLEDQLLQAQKMEAIGRLAGGVAHDFNNLLAAILGHCELLLRRLPEDHALRGCAEEIHKAGGRGALLTRQLLAFSRRDVPTLSLLEVRAVAGEMEGMLRRLIGEDIELQTWFGPDSAVVRADRAQLEQVIMNLVVNARDAMPHGGRISLEVRVAELDRGYAEAHPGVNPGSYAMIAVSDDGCGMDADTIAHVFEPFYTTKEQGRGTGLGLSTVYGIVERNGGSISVQSEPEHGSSFRVYLPRVLESVEVQRDLFDAPAPGGHETVLLVEDEDAVRDLVREALELIGYRVLTAPGGEQGLDLADVHPGPIHLLITDVVMPRMGGAELARLLSERRPDTRVLFMSGYTDDAVVRHGVLEARVAFLQKPFTLEALARRVRETLDSPPRPLPVPQGQSRAA